MQEVQRPVVKLPLLVEPYPAPFIKCGAVNAAFRFLAGLIVFFTYTGCALASPPTPINLTPGQHIFQIGAYLQYLEDPGGLLKIDDVASPEFSEKFTDSKEASLNMGITASAYWFRFSVGPEIRNPDETGNLLRSYYHQWILHPERYLTVIDEVRLYWKSYDSDGNWNARIGGLQEGIRTGRIQNHYLKLPPLTEVAPPITFYLRVEMKNSLFIKPRLQTLESYNRVLGISNYFFGIFFGMIVALVAYNLLLYASQRETVRLLFVCYITCLTPFFLVVDGLAYDFAPPRYIGLVRHSAQIILFLSISLVCLFAKEFLNIRKNLPIANRLLILFICLPLIMAPAAVFMSYTLVVKISITLTFIATTILIVLGIDSFAKGNRAARFFMPAYFFFLGGGIIFCLTYMGLLPFTLFNFYALQMGSGLEMVILNFAIADRTRLIINKLNEEQDQKQNQLAALSADLIRTEERERRRLATKLHDGIGQMLVSCKFKIEAMIRGKAADRDKSTHEVLETLKKAIEDTRSLTANLCPTTLYDLGLIPALQQLGDHFHNEFGLDVSIMGTLENQPRQIEKLTFFYRSASELLLNVVKHSKAAKSSVIVDEDGRSLRMVVNDPGVGMPEKMNQDPAKFGLFSIRERVKLMGGAMTILSMPGSGTRVILTLPS